MPNRTESASVQHAAAYLAVELWRCAYCGERMKSDSVRRHQADGLIEIRVWCANLRCQAFDVRGSLPVYALGGSFLDLLEHAPVTRGLPYLVLCASFGDFEQWRKEKGLPLREAIPVMSVGVLRGLDFCKYWFARASGWGAAPQELIEEFNRAEREAASAVTAQGQARPPKANP